MGVSKRSARIVMAERRSARQSKVKAIIDSKKKVVAKARLSAAPVPAPAPRRAAAAPRAPKQPAGARMVVCLGCINSALQMKGSGQCYDTVGKGARCFACSSGHKCVVAPAAAQAPFLAYRNALENEAGKKELEQLRIPVRAALKGGNVGGAAAAGAAVGFGGGVAPGAAGGFGGDNGDDDDEENEEEEEPLAAFAAHARVAGEKIAAAAGALFVEKGGEGAADYPAAAATAEAARAAAAAEAATGAARAYGPGPSVLAFQAMSARGVVLTPEQEAQAARVEELVGVMTSALGELVREVLGLPPSDR